jgi:hypothetical protein
MIANIQSAYCKQQLQQQQLQQQQQQLLSRCAGASILLVPLLSMILHQRL